VPNAPVSGWSVESQQETVAQDEHGRAVEGVRIAFITGKGQRGSVFVPRTRYNVENVRAALAGAAHQLDTVLDLKG